MYICYGLLGLFLCNLVQASPFSSQARLAVNPDPYPGRRIVFRNDSTFRLTVFSDLHTGENEYSFGPAQDVGTDRVMRTVLASDRPDYVVLNGDLITSENTYKENATLYIDKVVAPLLATKTKFSSTHGNHDNGVNISHSDEIAREIKVAGNLTYTRSAPAGVGGSQYRGPGNYWVPVYLNNSANSPSLILWFFDSRSGLYANGSSVPDYVDASVGPWIKSEVASMERAWGSSVNRQALAFVHIPPHAIQAVSQNLNNNTNPGLNDDGLGQGSTQASSPATAGKDSVWWDSLNTNVKNLRAIVSGHDHGNEWCAREPTKNVIFCFSKHSGYGGYNRPTWGHGVRNFVITAQQGNAFKVDTYIRLEGGETRARVTLDDKYGR